MDKKVTGIVAYVGMFVLCIPFAGVIAWVIAYLAGDKEGAKFHLNQALLLILANIVISVLTFIPVIQDFTWILSFVAFVFAIIGLVHAVKEEEKELPFIGGIQILK